jgi:peptidoglycan-N-acetylglucosamine deacetylase
MRRLKVVTTSWDDGDVRDLRVRDLLRSRGMTGTFYVPINAYGGRQRLSDCDLRSISSESCEIGAHTVSHRSLPTLTPNELNYEVQACKQLLEQTLGSEVLMFCYPNGRYNAETLRSVKNAGYLGARTTRMLSLRTQFPPFEMSTSIQAYPHSGLTYLKNQGRAKSVSGLARYLTELKRFETWVDLGKWLFDEVLQDGGIWHLYGHSWEIDKLGIWDELSDMLDHVSRHSDVSYLTNGELLSLVNRPRK